MDRESLLNPDGPQGATTGGATTAGDPTVITIAVVVCYDAYRVVQALVTSPIYLSSRIHQKVRWCVYNNLDITLSSVSIGSLTSGGSGGASLCSNTPNLTTGTIAPGNMDAACTQFCATAPCPSGTSFQYTVSVKPENQKEVNIQGPRVIIQ